MDAAEPAGRRTDWRPFIPAWMDELEISPIQFRILANLWRRAGQDNVAWPSGATIAEDCHIDRDTLWDNLTALEQAGLVKRSSARGTSNRYTLLVPVGRKRGPTGNGGPTKQAELTGLGVAESAGLDQAESAGLKGSPRKGTQEGSILAAPASPAAAKVSQRPRDALFEAIGAAWGIDLTQLTPSARGSMNAALKQIKAAMPAVTEADIRSRAAAYVRKYPTSGSCTPSALAKHWGTLGSRATISPALSTIAEPRNWRQRLAGTIFVQDERNWQSRSDDTKRAMIEALQRSTNANAA
jgi:hypothetical protein